MSTVLQPDILIENPTGGPVAIVELKNRQNLSPARAMEFHDTLSRYGYAFRAPYFLLLSQDTGYLWKEVPGDGDGARPTQQFSMRAVLARYLPDWPVAERLGETGLALLALHWLNALAAGALEADEDPERTLAEAGFLQAIQGASITSEPTL